MGQKGISLTGTKAGGRLVVKIEGVGAIGVKSSYAPLADFLDLAGRLLLRRPITDPENYRVISFCRERKRLVVKKKKQ